MDFMENQKLSIVKQTFHEYSTVKKKNYDDDVSL